MRVVRNPEMEIIKVLLKRSEVNLIELEGVVKEIFDDVSKCGDEALRKYTSKFDRVALVDFLVTKNEFEEAEKKVGSELKKAIQLAAENIKKFHTSQKESVVEVETMKGVTCWRKSIGIEKVGLYIPGGTAPLFSTVLMLGVPANIAGCEEVVLCTPCGLDGKVNPVVLYAAQLVGIEKVYKVGGIQAIAAMTFGTESIPNVYKIFGPGNQYVTAAKQYAQRFKVAIDMPAGPSEVMVVCDVDSNEKFVAADLLSQAEHGVDSQVVLICNDALKVELIQQELEAQLKELRRNEIAVKALDNSVAMIVDKSDFSKIINEYAPEHLILNTNFNEELIPLIKNAGSVFIGQYTPESAGDYASGTNHTLPTNGYARQYSGVSLDSFVKKITFQKITEEGLLNIGRTVELMAEAEGLDAHKNAITVRLNTLK